MLLSQQNCLFVLRTKKSSISSTFLEDMRLKSEEMFNKVFMYYYMDDLNNLGFEATEVNFHKFLKTNNINHIFVGSDGYTLPFLLEKIDSKIKIFSLFIDTEFMLELDKGLAQISCGIFTLDYFSQAYFEQIGIPSTFMHFLPNNQEKYKATESIKEIDVSFVGKYTPERDMYINYLKEKGIEVLWHGISKTPDGEISIDGMIELFNKSRINLNFTGPTSNFDNYIIEDPLKQRIKQIKARVFELSLTGSFCLSEHSPALKYFFNIPGEMDYFHTKEELYEKVVYYLNNASVRENMAKSAHHRALNNYKVDSWFNKSIITKFLAESELAE